MWESNHNKPPKIHLKLRVGTVSLEYKERNSNSDCSVLCTGEILQNAPHRVESIHMGGIN